MRAVDAYYMRVSAHLAQYCDKSERAYCVGCVVARTTHADETKGNIAVADDDGRLARACAAAAEPKIPSLVASVA